MYLLGAVTCAISGVVIIYTAISRPEDLTSIAKLLSVARETATTIVLLTGAIHTALAVLGTLTIITMWLRGRKRLLKYIALAASVVALLLVAGYIVGAIAMLITSVLSITKN